MLWRTLRDDFHRALCRDVLRWHADGSPNNADKSNRLSRALARGLWQAVQQRVACPFRTEALPPQRVGKYFEQVVHDYLSRAFDALEHLRPGPWRFYLNHRIEEFVQYRHLADLTRALKTHPALRAALGDYIIAPDILVAREPWPDAAINRQARPPLVAGREIAGLTPLRRVNNTTPILHASISCKWTIRSDRSQNVRTEGLNLIRNRKGHTPHIVVITAEPAPSRLASLAMGTGDLDAVYHIALSELRAAAQRLGDETAEELLTTMVEGQRLRDISDLPFDLAV